MEDINGCLPGVLTMPDEFDQIRSMKASDEVARKGRTNSWPLLPTKFEAGVSANAINSARMTWNARYSRTAASMNYRPAAVIHQPSYISEKSTEFPGSPDVFLDIEDLSSVATSLREEAPPLPPWPATRSSLYQASHLPELASRPDLSSRTGNVHPHLRHTARSDDLKRRYTLEEALEMLPNKPCGRNNGVSLDSITGRILPSYMKNRREKVPTDTKFIKEGLDEHGQPQTRFHSQKPRQTTTLEEPRLRHDRSTKRSAKNVITKVIRPITWFRSKMSKHSTRSTEPNEAIKIGQPFNPRHFRGSVAGFQDLNSSNATVQSQMNLSQMRFLERDADPVVSANITRLSITDSFGPTLAECINGAILKSESPDVTKPLSSTVSSY